jgi:two-component system, chemotaxis family, protein-glutamate methylesterase/glutaminase
MAEPIRVLIVDDSAFVRRAVERMLSDLPDMEVVGTAANGADAVAMVKRLSPDVVILDVNMPELDGLEALQRIMAESPTSVLMMSTLTREGARTTLRALDLGAVDFVDKTAAGTVMDIYGLGPMLREKVRAIAGASPPPPARPAAPEREVGAPLPSRPPHQGRFELIAIGTSTGGPRALVEVISGLPGDLDAGIVIAQHMPAGFTQTLAERLNKRSPLEVVEAKDGDEVVPGRALIAPGGTQMIVERAHGRLVCRVDASPSGQLHRPSVDVLFNSVAEVVGARAIGVVLTGMGDDGARGLAAMREAGARTLAESEETAVIFGMPRAAAPAAEKVLPLPQIAPWLRETCGAWLTARGA